MVTIRIIFGLAFISAVTLFTGFPGAWKSGFVLFSLVVISILSWRAGREIGQNTPKQTGDTFTESHS